MTLKRLASFLWRERWWWLAPTLIALAFVAALLVFAARGPATAPFVYTLF